MSPFLSGAWAPLPQELERASVEVVQGEVPRELNGSYLRSGANQRFAPRDAHHPFDGDGMLHAFRFEDERERVESFPETEATA
jgi:carotenoid cleavage dioxygenase